MAKKTKEIQFTPYKGIIVLTVPTDAVTASELIVDEKVKKATEEKNLKEYVESGNALVVSAVGEGCDFVAKGDKIFTASHARLQGIELEGDESKYFAIREGDILGKLK